MARQTATGDSNASVTDAARVVPRETVSRDSADLGRAATAPAARDGQAAIAAGAANPAVRAAIEIAAVAASAVGRRLTDFTIPFAQFNSQHSISGSRV